MAFSLALKALKFKFFVQIAKRNVGWKQTWQKNTQATDSFREQTKFWVFNSNWCLKEENVDTRAEVSGKRETKSMEIHIQSDFPFIWSWEVLIVYPEKTPEVDNWMYSIFFTITKILKTILRKLQKKYDTLLTFETSSRKKQTQNYHNPNFFSENRSSRLQQELIPERHPGSNFRPKCCTIKAYRWPKTGIFSLSYVEN